MKTIRPGARTVQQLLQCATIYFCPREPFVRLMRLCILRCYLERAKPKLKYLICLLGTDDAEFRYTARVRRTNPVHCSSE